MVGLQYDVTKMPYKELERLVQMLSCEVEYISKTGRKVVLQAC
ncbi:MAG: hypothetical protein ACP5IG_00240 [Candidatus Micrarchaeia archaeon]